MSLIVSGMVVGTGTAAAAPGSVYGKFTIGGSSGAFDGSLTMAAGFPPISYSSNSLAPATAPSGQSAFLRAGTPFAAEYGPSDGQGYLNLRPAANNAASPSTTTYSFQAPTPGTGWGFALGDIDADQVAVSATGLDGSTVPVADLGFAGTFNYCSAALAAPAPSACAGPSEEVPSWDPVAGVLTGNAAALDTSGATGWFQPTVPLLTLTFVFTWRGGFPIYQTWFAAQTAAVSGTVTVAGAQGLAGVSVDISATDSPFNSGTAVTGPDGSFSFDGLALQNYTLSVQPPFGYVSAGGDPTTHADLTNGDVGNVDFLLAPLYEAGGTVTLDGVPLGSAVVDCVDRGGAIFGTAFTNPDGSYRCPPAPPGTGYSVVLVEGPDGVSIEPSDLFFDIVDAPVTNLNFVRVTRSAVAGSVVDGQGVPVPDIPVSLVDQAGERTAITRTDVNGLYEFPDVRGGPYTVLVPATVRFGEASVDIVAPLPGRAPQLTLIAIPPPVTTTVVTVTSTATSTGGSTVLAASTSTVQTIVAVVDAAAGNYLPATGTHASELVPAGVGLVTTGGVLLLFGRRRRGTHLG